MLKSTALVLFASIFLLVPGCLTADTTGSYEGCIAITPATTDPSVVCDIGWACDGDSAHYSLTCSYQAGNYACTCRNEGVVSKEFAVNPFTCDAQGALPAARSACGWPLEFDTE